MSDEESTGTAMSRKSVGPGSALSGGRGVEPTQRFSALQQQLLCAAIHFFHRHIRSDPDVLQRMEGNAMFQLFFEVQYHGNKPDLNRIFPESVHDCSALHVCSFILSILHQGIFSVSAFIVSVIYLSRFKESSHITLHACTWRPLFLTSLLLADKMWEDKPVRNSSLAKLFPVLSNSELNKMEGEFLGEIRFNVLVKPDLFCSFCEKLLAEQVHQEITTCVSQSEYAATLQADNVETSSMPKMPPAPKAPVAEVAKAEPVNAEEAPRWPSGAAVVGGGSGLAPPSAVGAAPTSQAAPRAQSAGAGSRRPVADAAGANGQATGYASQGPSSLHARPGEAQPQPQAQPHGGPPHPAQPQPGLQSLMALRGSVGSSAQAMALKSAAQPLRSVSVHPLHRNDSMKKHAMGKAEDSGDKSSRPGPPMRRSLPAKTSNSAYAPLSRVAIPAAGSAPFSSGGSGGAGRCGDGVSGASQASSGIAPGDSAGTRGSSLAEAAVSNAGRPCGGGSASSAGCAGVTPMGVPLLHVSGPGAGGSAGLAGGGSRHLPQSSPRSPGMSTVVLAQERAQPHPHQPQSRSSSQAHGQSAQQQGQGIHSRSQAPRVATPPVPMNNFSAGQGSQTGAKLQSRVASPGGSTAAPGTTQQLMHQSQQPQPARASSAPRVSGIGAHHHATPPTGSTVRTTSQPMQAASGYARHPHPVVFQQGPQGRGSSPAPGMAMVGGSMAMNSGRGSIGGHHHVVVPTAQMPFSGGVSVVGAHRADLLSATRGRSPPPGAAPGSGTGTVRAPRAVTPGALVKGITQGLQGGGVPRNSLGSAQIGMMVHRGMG